MQYEDEDQHIDYSDYSNRVDRRNYNRSDGNTQHHNRRHTDGHSGPSAPSKHNPSLKDIYAVLGAIQKQLDTIETRLTTQSKAFTRNELGEPDFDGHRTFHTKSIEAAAALQKYKTGLTKSLLEWIMKGGIAVMGLGLLSLIGTRLSEFVK